MFTRAWNLDSTYAGLAFEIGKAYLGKDPCKADRCFIRANDLDLLKFRAPSAFDPVIEKAAGTCGAYLVDLKQAFYGHSKGVPPGDELFFEHVHPNLQGYALMAASFAGRISRCFGAGKQAAGADGAVFSETLPVIRIDTLYAELAMPYLKTGWPFKENPSHNTAGTLYQTVNRAISLEKETEEGLQDKGRLSELARIYEILRLYDRAAGMYERILLVDPSDSIAREYLENDTIR